MKDREQLSPEGIYIPQKQISIHKLFRGSVPEQSKYRDHKVRDFYYQLATQPLSPHIKTFGGTTDFMIACPPLKGEELQQVFHFAAPSKAFGVDYSDTQKDWDELYSKPDNLTRLNAHKQLPGWEVLEEYRVLLKDFIGRDMEKKAVKNERAVPIIHVIQENGEIRWDFRAVGDEQKEILAQHAGNFPVDALRYIPALGPLFIAAFSPDTTTSWGERLNYKLEKKGATQDMGSTQVFALSIALSHTLIETPALQSLITYTKTEELPRVLPGQEVQVKKRPPGLIKNLLKNTFKK